MIEILNEQTLQDPMIIGLANVVLMEVGKRLPQIPLDPSNPNQLRFVSGCLVLLSSVVYMLARGTFDAGDLLGSLNQLAQMWLMGWVISHTAYNALPFMKPEAKPDDQQ